jgi:hypothetical protein
MPLLRAGAAPPDSYYADNLLRMLATVVQQYSDLLRDDEIVLVRCIERLPAAPLRLYARLLTRKGPLFRCSQLNYAEIPDRSAALARLHDQGLIEWCPPGAEALALFTRRELRTCFADAMVPRAVRKHEQIASLRAMLPEVALSERLARHDPWLALAHEPVLSLFPLLFFGIAGDRGQMFSTFVLEDLGVRRYERYPLTPAHRLFPTRAALDRFLHYGVLAERLASLADTWDSRAAEELLHSLDGPQPHRVVERRRSRLLNQLGRMSERAGNGDIALRCYASSTREPARERQVRLLLKRGDVAAAQLVLSAVQTTPWSAGEQLFAEQCVARLARRRRQTIPEQRLRLAAAPAQGVERAAMQALIANGGCGIHLENRLPMSLLALATWDIVFSDVPGAFVNAYQPGPLDLFWPDFRATRASALAARLDALRDPARLRATVEHNFEAKYGVAHALMHWGAFDRVLLGRLLATIPAEHLVAWFDYALNDLAQCRAGFPDLVLLYGPGHYRLVEVKGPGDQLRREQKLWFGFFARAGIPATVLRVTW